MLKNDPIRQLIATLFLSLASRGRSKDDKFSNYGVAAAIEFTPIENWFEIELGLTALNTSGRTALSGDLLLKKLFRLSPSAEFMIGLGPQVGRTFRGMKRGNSVALEGVLDLMVWSTNAAGFYLEPSDGYGLGKNKGERSVGGSAGLLVRW